MKTTLLLIRHGESLANKEHFFAGSIDVPLIENGITQANLSAQFVKEHYRVDAIYSSDLQRAYGTAQCFADLFGLDITKDKGLRELFAGAWEGKKHDELLELYPEEYGNLWHHHTGKVVCPGGESVKGLGERVMESLKTIAEKHSGQTVLVATHATPVRVAQCLVQYKSVDFLENVPRIPNASVTEIAYENGQWTLVRANMNEHLANAQSSFTTIV